MVRDGTGLLPCLVGGPELNFIAKKTPFKSKITCRGYVTSLREDWGLTVTKKEGSRETKRTQH